MNDKLVKNLEFAGVILRMGTFLMLSIMGKDTPFLTMWIINTMDATLLTYCAIKRHNRAYTIMNIFWLIVGTIGIINSI
jgi:hypothetical protein